MFNESSTTDAPWEKRRATQWTSTYNCAENCLFRVAAEKRLDKDIDICRYVCDEAVKNGGVALDRRQWSSVPCLTLCYGNQFLFLSSPRRQLIRVMTSTEIAVGTVLHILMVACDGVFPIFGLNSRMEIIIPSTLLVMVEVCCVVDEIHLLEFIWYFKVNAVPGMMTSRSVVAVDRKECTNTCSVPLLTLFLSALSSIVLTRISNLLIIYV